MLNFFRTRISLASNFEKTKVKLGLLTDIDISFNDQNGIRGSTCHVIYQYLETNNNRYIKGYDKNDKNIICYLLGCE